MCINCFYVTYKIYFLESRTLRLIKWLQLSIVYLIPLTKNIETHQSNNFRAAINILFVAIAVIRCLLQVHFHAGKKICYQLAGNCIFIDSHLKTVQDRIKADAPFNGSKGLSSKFLQ